MPSIPLHPSILSSLRAVSIASDRDKASPSICGVSVTLHPLDGVTLAATDGKFLIEHVIPASDAYLAGLAPMADTIHAILADGPTLCKRLKSLRTHDKNKKPVPLTLDHDGKRWTLCDGQSAVTLGLVDAVFPNYRATLDNTTGERIGWNPTYLAMVQGALELDDHRAAVATLGRGTVFERLDKASTVRRRALVMPISIPVDGPQYVKITQAELDDLCKKAHAPRDPAGEVRKAIDDYKREHPPGAAEDSARQIASLEKELQELREKLTCSENMRADLLKEHQDLNAYCEKLREKTATGQPTTGQPTTWMPTKQGKQLEAAGLQVDDLKAAGFRWVPAARAWESYAPEAPAILARLESAQ